MLLLRAGEYCSRREMPSSTSAAGATGTGLAAGELERLRRGTAGLPLSPKLGRLAWGLLWLAAALDPPASAADRLGAPEVLPVAGFCTVSNRRAAEPGLLLAPAGWGWARTALKWRLGVEASLLAGARVRDGATCLETEASAAGPAAAAPLPAMLGVSPSSCICKHCREA